MFIPNMSNMPNMPVRKNGGLTQTNIQQIGLAVTLLVAIYYGFSGVLLWSTALNTKRDIILNFGIEAAKQVSHNASVHIFWFDWIPMWFGLLCFIGMYAAILYRLPHYIGKDEALTKELHHLRDCCIWIPVVGLIGFLIGGLGDIVTIYHYLH